eukprot:sb/3473838/
MGSAHWAPTPYWLVLRTSQRVPRRKRGRIFRPSIQSPFLPGPLVLWPHLSFPELLTCSNKNVLTLFIKTLFSLTLQTGIHLIVKLKMEKIFNNDDPNYGSFFKYLDSVLMGWVMPTMMLEKMESACPEWGVAANIGLNINTCIHL